MKPSFRSDLIPQGQGHLEDLNAIRGAAARERGFGMMLAIVAARRSARRPGGVTFSFGPPMMPLP